MIKPNFLKVPHYERVEVWTASNIRTMCIEHDFYTCGTNSNYCDLLSFIDETEPTFNNVYAAAFDIVMHSDTMTLGCTMLGSIELVIEYIYSEAVRTVIRLDRTGIDD